MLPMRVSFNASTLSTWKGNVLVVGVSEEQKEDQLKSLNDFVNGDLNKILEEKNFKAKNLESECFELITGPLNKLILVAADRHKRQVGI